MDEFASRFAIGTEAGMTEVSRSKVTISRGVVSQIARRDPRGNLGASQSIFSTFGVQWDFEMGDDAGSIAAVLSGLCDDSGLTTGQAEHVPVHKAAVAMPDGAQWLLENGVLRDFQIVINARAVVQLSTVWQFGKITAAAFVPDEAVSSSRKASGLTSSVAMGTVEATQFSGTLAFSREASPAGFGLDGAARWFSGRINVDLVGTFRVRLSSANAFTALAGQFTDSLVVSIRAGLHVFTVTVLAAVFQVKSRRVVANDTVDYELEMLAVKGTGPLASFTSTGGSASFAAPV